MCIRNRDIVIIGLQPWYTKIGSNCKNIAQEFAKENRVLYVNVPLDRRTAMTEKNNPDISHHLQVVNGKEPSLVQLNENFWNLYPSRVLESINWLPSTSLFSVFNKLNNRRFAKSIQAAIRQLGFENIILFNDNDIFRGYHLKELLRPAVYVYYSRDYLLAVDYWKKHGEKIEPMHIAKADVGVANSLYLADRLKTYNPNSYYVGQGCDLNLFNPDKHYEMPTDITGISGTVIGYVGALTSLRLDIPLLEKMAQAKPQWKIVLVGHEDEAFRKSALHHLPNVYFTGGKPMHLLPAYIRHFDICINPQVVNDLTVGNYPLKVDEYLAMGKPVLATRTPTMELFRDHVYLAEDLSSYISQAEKALAENSDEKAAARRGFALSHTWENSAAAIYDAILSFEQPVKRGHLSEHC
ncbi:glycosyltransferase [Chitinophaga sp. Mgbs1]|uniref:Glycosyltransferase n=1 Tax=Chitinophaga solisilvae TaxID=1233460 RepID=A0A3S1DNF1_9BACT|nr:glycosyltransferase [Chitinophaga solisilvae]